MFVELVRAWCLLDSILVNKLNGPASVWAVRCRTSKRPVTSSSKRDRRPEDRGTVAGIRAQFTTKEDRRI